MQRRGFLKKLGLFSATAALPVGALLAGERKESNLIKGRVHCKGKGLAGVVVSDGFVVTVTDNNGNYSLWPHDNAAFLFVSTPAGYEPENEKGLTRFYRKITREANQKADFELKQLALDDNKHAFILWADTQIWDQADADLLKSVSASDTLAVVKTLGNVPVHGIGCGDLVWDRPDLFGDYTKAIEITGIPFYQVIGNHDIDYKTARSDEQSQDTFKSLFGPTYYSFNKGKVHYVVLDDVFFIGQKKRYIGYVPEEQLQWLEKDLSYVPKDHLIVLSLHIPTNSGDARRRELKEDELGGVVSNREHLYNLLKAYNVHILSGHTHWNENWEKGKIMEHNHGTVCGAWWTGPVCGDGTPAGYGVYEIDGADIKWYYKSTGMAKDKQLRIYDKGRLKDAPEEISVNVWNWDSKWKVEWYEDEVLKGPMDRRIAYDPWTVELYAGPQLPIKHKFVEPILTDHMFFARPAANAKKITVKATDRFGNVYSEVLHIGG